MHHASRAPPTSSERYHQLRALTVLVFPLSFSLLLSCGLDEYEPLPVIGIAPMALSAVLGALAFRGIAPGTKALLDIFVAVFLMSVLVPRCVQTDCGTRVSRACDRDRESQCVICGWLAN